MVITHETQREDEAEECISCGRGATHFDLTEIGQVHRCEYHRQFEDHEGNPRWTYAQRDQAWDRRADLIDADEDASHMTISDLLFNFKRDEDGRLVPKS